MDVKTLQNDIDNVRSDIWKFTDFTAFKKADFSPVNNENKGMNGSNAGIESRVKDVLKTADFKEWITIVDGAFSETHSSINQVRLDVSSGETQTELTDHVLAANQQQAPQQLFLHIEGAIEAKTVGVILVQKSNTTAARVEVVVGESVQTNLQIVEIGSGIESHPNLANHSVALTLKKNANVQAVIYAQNQQFSEETNDAFRLLNTTFNLHESSTLNVLDLMQNCALSRHQLTVNFKGEQSEANLFGLGYFVKDARQHTHITVNHDVKDCTSSQLYKQLMFDTARAEFSGLVSVAEGASGTLSNQSNPNLIFSDDARAYSRPQLNILNDDVQCNHGSTIGQLDELAVFYLKSRGISEQDARNVLLQGFIEDIFESFDGVSHIQSEWKQALMQVLQSTKAS